MTTSESVKAARWRELQGALSYIHPAEFEIGRGDTEAAVMWLEDARRALGAVALLCGSDPDSEGYARLLNAVLEPVLEFPPDITPEQRRQVTEAWRAYRGQS